MPPTDVIFILDDEDEDGNATAVQINANSGVMATASPFFEAMFAANKFKEGCLLQNKGSVEVKLPETNAKAFAILCDVFHLRSKEDSGAELGNDLDTLYEIATLVDRYGCAGAIQPWPKVWLDPLKVLNISEEEHKVSQTQLIRWVHVAGQLGYEKIFRKYTAALILRIPQKQLDSYMEHGEMQRLGPNLRDAILQSVDSCFREVREALGDFINELSRGEGCRKDYRANDKKPSSCSSLLLGRAIIGMERLFGADWRGENPWDLSLNEVRNKILENCFILKQNDPTQIDLIISRNARGTLKFRLMLEVVFWTMPLVFNYLNMGMHSIESDIGLLRLRFAANH